MHILAGPTFSSWHFPYFVSLVAEKHQSSSHQNKNLQTLGRCVIPHDEFLDLTDFVLVRLAEPCFVIQKLLI